MAAWAEDAYLTAESDQELLYNDSDVRLKRNIVTIEGALEKVKRLRGVNFEWEDGTDRPKGLQMGMIAQEVIEIVPEVVERTGVNYSMSTSSLVALLVEAVKEQQRTIEDQQKQIDALKAEVSSLR
jgi:hypothetical protein